MKNKQRQIKIRKKQNKKATTTTTKKNRTSDKCN